MLHLALPLRRARIFEHCVQPATNLKQFLYTKSAYRFGSRPYVTDCPAQGSHHITTIGDERCVRSRFRCTCALARGVGKLGSCISAAVFMVVKLDMAALTQKFGQRRERGALVMDVATLLPYSVPCAKKAQARSSHQTRVPFSLKASRCN